MSFEPAESAAIRVTWTDPESEYDLRWYGASDFIVPMWWIGVSELSTGELQRTEVLAPKLELPAEVFSWLVPLVGHEAARGLVSRAARIALSGAPRREGGPSEAIGTPHRRRPRDVPKHRRRRLGADSRAAAPAGLARPGRRGPARRAS